jgi:hypothetical protein
MSGLPVAAMFAMFRARCDAWEPYPTDHARFAIVSPPQRDFLCHDSQRRYVRFEALLLLFLFAVRAKDKCQRPRICSKHFRSLFRGLKELET